MAALTGAILGIAGAGLSAYGSIQQGNAQQKAMEYNATLSELQAENIRRQGEIEQYQMGVQKALLRKKQTAVYAKSGVTFEGSPFEVMLDSAKAATFDMMIAEYNTKVGIMGAKSEAEMDRYYGKVYKQQGQFKAGTTLMTAGANLYSSYGGKGWSQPKQTFDFGPSSSSLAG
jgi:hypothetical protein